MGTAFLIGLLAMAGYGLFLSIRALIRLYRDGERKLVYYAIGFVVLAPLLLWLSAQIPEERWSIWTVLPTLILFGIWICFGYFLESFRKNRDKEISMGIYKKQPPKPINRLRNIIVLLIGVLLWVIGAIIPIPNGTIEILLLCISVFLVASGAGAMWRYRKF